MGKLIVCMALLAGLTAPAFLSAAPGNPFAELGREEVKFQGMYEQLNTWYCGGGQSGKTLRGPGGGSSVNFEGLLRTLNSRRAQAYRQRGRNAPEPFYYSCEGGQEG